MTNTDFRTSDYILFVLSLVLSLAIGIFSAFSGKKQTTTTDYLMGGRQLNPVAVSVSIFMSFVSSIMILSNPAEMYLWGVQYWLIGPGIASGFILVAYIMVPFFYDLQIISSCEVSIQFILA